MIDLGEVSFEDAEAIQRALRVAIDSGELWQDESYKAIVKFRVGLAEQLCPSGVKVDA